MGLVNSEAWGFRGRWVLWDVALVLWGVPETGVVDRRDVEVLGDAGDPGREAFYALAVGQNHGDL